MIQVPATNVAFVEASGVLSRTGQEFASGVAGELNNPRTTTTANRPTRGVPVGQDWYDLTLGRPIWVATINPVSWVFSDGTPA